MKPAVLLPVCILASVASAYLVTSIQKKEPAAGAAHAAAPDSAGDLARAVDELRASQTEIRRTLDELRSSAERRDGRLASGDLDAAIDRALAARGATPVTNAEPAAPTAAAKKPSAKDLLARLAVEDLSEAQTMAIWKEAAEAGLVDELVGLYETAAKDRPNDPAAQVDLGHAYLQKLFTVPSGPEQGNWATKADQSFDAALALDDHHWEARFSKAMSLSFWPPIFGKTGTAIAQFETLVAQQAGQTQKKEYAQVHLLLGNMYQQSGQKDKAVAAWQNGLSLFPGNAELAQQIAGAQGN
jgi:tetratricopeptide (TPR) repeat protein